MSRNQVRFQHEVLRSPDDPASPHHEWAPNPKGILLKAGAFDKKIAKRTYERRERRYSTPAEVTDKTQKMILADPYRRHDYRSRRRSFSGDVVESTPSDQHRTRDSHYDSSSHYSRTPQAPSSRRDSLYQSVPRPAPSSVVSKQQNSTPNSRDSKRLQDDRQGFHVAYERPSGAHLMPPQPYYPGGTPYHYPGSLPAGFLQGTATTRSSTYYNSSPGSQGDNRPLPERDSRRRLQASLKDIKTVRALQSPRVEWNVASPFSSAGFNSSSRLLLSELDQFATKPGIDVLSIKFDDSKSQRLVRSFWRTIKIKGKGRWQQAGAPAVAVVTVRDVINGIYDFFQEPLTQKEYDSLSSDEAQLVLKSQRRRMGRNPYGFGAPLRVDLLGGYLRFEGVQHPTYKDGRLYFPLDLSRW